MLRVGGLGWMGLELADLLRADQAGVAAAAEKPVPKPARAKACILLYLYGAPSQLETFDMKPDAPAEIRGTFESIETSVPGLRICEYLPRVARVLDRTTVIRSMSHPYNIHSAAYTLTGVPQVDVAMELNPYDTRHWPYIGSVLEYLEEHRTAARSDGGVPRNLALPFPFSSRAPEFLRGGPYGGFLGRTYDPVWTEFEGRATKSVSRWRGGDIEVADPYLGISPDSRFLISRSAQLPAEISLDRLDRRRRLLDQLDDARRDLADSPSVEARDRFQQMAFSMITSAKVREALDLSRESAANRQRYGATLFGQAVLAARRMIEAGSQLVTVFWDEYQTANSAWDTHFDHFARLKDELLPGFDQAFSSLILDLEGRGMLDSTLVACVSEHGRTPRLESARGGGRGHWSKSYCGLFAGGGIRPGQVVGRSDRHAAEIDDRPVSPKDILRTIYHQLGVDPETLLHDRFGRPYPLVSGGEVVRELLA
jgi:hypothetical protein